MVHNDVHPHQFHRPHNKEPRRLLPLRNCSVPFMSSHLTLFFRRNQFKVRAAWTAAQIAMDTVQMSLHSVIGTWSSSKRVHFFCVNSFSKVHLGIYWVNRITQMPHNLNNLFHKSLLILYEEAYMMCVLWKLTFTHHTYTHTTPNGKVVQLRMITCSIGTANSSIMNRMDQHLVGLDQLVTSCGK